MSLELLNSTRQPVHLPGVNELNCYYHVRAKDNYSALNSIQMQQIYIIYEFQGIVLNALNMPF